MRDSSAQNAIHAWTCPAQSVPRVAVRRRTRMYAYLLVLLIVLLSMTAFLSAGAKEVVGWVEKAVVYPGTLEIKAKVDTGAKTSSLNCQCINPIKRDGKDWVSFSLKNEDGETIMLEKPIHRIARIKRHFGDQQVRYVVMMGICLGDTYREAEVTLVDRSGFNYQMLIGRNFLQDDFLVDPSATFLKQPGCLDPPVSQ